MFLPLVKAAAIFGTINFHPSGLKAAMTAARNIPPPQQNFLRSDQNSIEHALVNHLVYSSGKTAEALRILLRVVGMKGNARVNLKINEPVGGKREQEHKTVDQVVEEL